MKLWEKRVIAWVTLAIFLVTAIIAMYSFLSVRSHIEDIHHEMRPTVEMMNHDVPEFVTTINATADTFRTSVARVLRHTEHISLSAEVVAQTAAETSENMKLVLRLMGLEGETKEKSTLAYVVSLIEFVRESHGVIGLAKVWGSGLDRDEMYYATEWADGERAALLLLVLANTTHREILENFCKNNFGRVWFIVFDNQKPIELKTWILQNHAETIAYLRHTAKVK